MSCCIQCLLSIICLHFLRAVRRLFIPSWMPPSSLGLLENFLTLIQNMSPQLHSPGLIFPSCQVRYFLNNFPCEIMTEHITSIPALPGIGSQCIPCVVFNSSLPLLGYSGLLSAAFTLITPSPVPMYNPFDSSRYPNQILSLYLYSSLSFPRMLRYVVIYTFSEFYCNCINFPTFQPVV